MVSRIEVIPSEVRGYGNIIEAKSVSDFVPIESNLDVNSENMYSLTAVTKNALFVGEGRLTGWYDGQSFTISNLSLENGKVKWTVPSSDKYLGYYTTNTQSIAGKTLCTTIKLSSVKNVKVIAYAYTNEWTAVHNVLIPSGGDEVTIYTQIPFNATRFWVRLQQNSSTGPLNQGDIVYVEKFRTYIVDYLFKDGGTSLTAHINSLWNLTNIQMNRFVKYTELVETTIGVTGNIISSPHNRIPMNSVIEFDFLQVDGAKTQTPIYIRNSGGGVSLGWVSLNQLNCEVGEWIHLKIVIEDTVSYKIYVNDNPTPITLTLSQMDVLYRLFFSTNGDITRLRYRNLVCYPLYEYLFKYDGVGGAEGANFVGADARVLVETTPTGTSLTGVSGFYVYWANVPQTSTDAFDFTGNTIIEFDVVEISNNGAILQIYDNNDAHTYFNKKLKDDMGVTEACHIKIKVIGNLVAVYRDGNIVNSCTTQMTLTNPYRIGFRGYEGWNLKFKNFTVMKPLTPINLVASQTMLSYADSDSTTFIATHNLGAGQAVNLYNATDNTLIGVMTDNEDGTYSYTYNSQAIGDLTVYASDGNLSSETYEIFDWYYYETIEEGVLKQGTITHQGIGRSSIAISDEWSAVGDYSIKITSTNSGWGAYRIQNPVISKKGTVKFDCKNTGNVGYNTVFLIGGREYVVSVNKTTDFEGTVQLDYDFVDKEGDITRVDIRGYSRTSAQEIIYLDNIRIFKKKE